MIRKIFKVLISIVLLLVLAAAGFMVYQGMVSRQGMPPGLVNDRLAPCPDTPNCISSEDPDDGGHFLPPFIFTPVDDIDVRGYIAGIVEDTGGIVTSESGDYVSAEYRSRVIGFVDDVEFRVDNLNGRVHVRSASRVGKSDLGVNPKRYQALRQAFEAALGSSDG
jgi:uncharacterized protein (DUF1499 family)